jgi:hypothetical protein
VTIVCDNAEHEEREVSFDVPSFELAYRQFTGIPEEPLAPPGAGDRAVGPARLRSPGCRLNLCRVAQLVFRPSWGRTT